RGGEARRSLRLPPHVSRPRASTPGLRFRLRLGRDLLDTAAKEIHKVNARSGRIACPSASRRGGRCCLRQRSRARSQLSRRPPSSRRPHPRRLRPTSRLPTPPPSCAASTLHPAPCPRTNL